MSPKPTTCRNFNENFETNIDKNYGDVPIVNIAISTQKNKLVSSCKNGNKTTIDEFRQKQLSSINSGLKSTLESAKNMPFRLKKTGNTYLKDFKQ